MRLVAWVVGSLLASFACSSVASAQRATGDSAWQGKKASIEYTATRVGKHSVDELAVGATWRLGSGPATILTLEAPLIGDGDVVVAPGHYRAQLSRRGPQQFDLTIEGGGRLVGIGENADLKGKLDESKTASKTLEIKLEPATEQKDSELRKLDFVVTFGVPRVTVPATQVGVISKKGGGATIDGFKFPSELVNQRLGGTPLPVASVNLSGGGKDAPKAFNVLLTEKEAQLVAQDTPPADAFSPVPAHDKQWDRTGSVTWTDAAEEVAHFTLEDAKWEKGKQLTVVARVGKRKAEIVIPLDKAK